MIDHAQDVEDKINLALAEHGSHVPGQPNPDVEEILRGLTADGWDYIDSTAVGGPREIIITGKVT